MEFTLNVLGTQKGKDPTLHASGDTSEQVVPISIMALEWGASCPDYLLHCISIAIKP